MDAAFPAFFSTGAIPRLIEEEVAYCPDLPIGSRLALCVGEITEGPGSSRHLLHMASQGAGL